MAIYYFDGYKQHFKCLDGNEVNTLTEDAERVISESGYDYSHDAVKDIISIWRKSKENLINLLSKHPNWDEETLSVSMQSNDLRRHTILEIRELFNGIKNLVLSYGEATEKMKAAAGALSAFFTEDEIAKNACSGCIDSIIHYCASDGYDMRIHRNERVTRVVQKFCNYYGISAINGFNRAYGLLCDSLSPIKIERKFILSVHPNDYLLMSNGNSWHSCQLINPEDGCYQAGTQSYMLDKTSMVFYILEKDASKPYWASGKLKREIMAFENGYLLQSRLYPQNDSDDTCMMDDVRKFVQTILAEAIGTPNLWTVSSCSDKLQETLDEDTCKMHYSDYFCGFKFTLSTLKDCEHNGKLSIGHEAYCIMCGDRLSDESSLTCYDCRNTVTCEDCGRTVDRDDATFIDGCWYCSECVVYCDSCDEPMTFDQAIEVDGNYYCRHCYENKFSTCDECGAIIERDELIETVDGKYVCDECVVYCDDCGEAHSNNTNLTEIDGCWYCEDCAENHKDDESEE